MSSKDAKENVQQLLDTLRDSYIKYKETLGRCKIDMKPKNVNRQQNQQDLIIKKPENFKNFYVQPKVIQLDEPEKQKRFRKEYIAEVGARPEAEQTILVGDELHYEELSQIANHANPSIAREDLAAFFRRRRVQLQHKKYKILGRWANQATNSQTVDQNALMFEKMLGRLQQEFDSSTQRSERLAEDDSYDQAIDPKFQRPQPTSKEDESSVTVNQMPSEGKPGGKDKTLLYIESPEKIINSSIRDDDIEVYLRIQTYRSKIFRTAEKLATSIKWLPYSHRFDIWTQSRRNLAELKQKYIQNREKTFEPLNSKFRERLVGLAGFQDDDKLLHQVLEKFISHLKQEQHHSRNIAALNCHKMTHEKPPMMIASNQELNIFLVPLAHGFDLQTGEFLEMDDGHNFSYQVQGLFAPKFQQQVLKMQFDFLDTGEISKEETDVLLIHKLTTELSLNKNDMLAEMARQAEIERGKSILGRLGKNGLHNENIQKKHDENSPDNDANQARNNLIRRIREMKFFSLDETDYKLVRADWLKYICWEPCISDFVKRQNNMLSNSIENPIDSLLLSSFEFTDVNEAGAVNKILEDAATAHLRQVRAYFTEISQKNSKGNFKNKDLAEKNILKQAIRNESNKFMSPYSDNKSDEPSSYNSSRVEGFLQNVDPLKHNLMKSFYTLRLLKCREMKCQLIQTLNYFRAVQKRLAFDVKEFYSRERGLGGQKQNEALIGPQFGKDKDGNLRSKTCGTLGPGQINTNRLVREYDMSLHIEEDKDGNKRADPISLKGYKYNKKFNPELTSTCPCMPKYHTTFGRPSLYEEISQEIERNEIDCRDWRDSSKPIISYKDRLIFVKPDFPGQEYEISVYDQHGIKIMYQEALNDMICLEEEMLKIGSFFLNKAEILQHTNPNQNPVTMIDRGEVTQHLLDQELKLQVQKVELIEILLQIYENTCDPLECVRMIQIISDVMAVRPRINLDATYFNDSYKLEHQVLQSKIMLYGEMLELQKGIEIQENEKVRKFQELKFRKLQDYCQGKWTYQATQLKHKVTRVGAKEESAINQGLEQSKHQQKMRKMEEIIKRKTLEEITQRHITEFAGEQATDFANVLGLPQITVLDLFKKQGQLDPILIDAIRENTHFSKQIEGYPWFFQKSIVESQSLGLHVDDLGMFDFFESLSVVTRINAACDQAFEELVSVHRPENGMAASSLELSLLQQACGQLKVQRSRMIDNSYSESKTQGLLEEDFYLSSPDKLLFIMRELKSELNKDRIQESASPLHVAKLKPSEVAKYDFPRLRATDVDDFQQANEQEIAEKMIALAKDSITRRFGDESKIALMSEEEKLQHMISSPSMLEMGCNTIEITRLRDDLIQIQHEINILSEIYSEQLKKSNKTTWKIRGYDPIPFEIQSIAKDNMNYVDKNDGSTIEFGIEVEEFDANIMANMNFKSESCVKSLMINIGVEELRAVVHYQLMQKHLLAIGIVRNQSLLDGTQQGFEELELTKTRPCLSVPGSMIRLNDVLQRQVDGPHSEYCKSENTRLSTSLEKEAGQHLYSIAVRKNRYRPIATKKYNALIQKLNTQKLSAETKLRILRSFRLSLIHDFCFNVLHEAYKDSIQTQIVLALRELRLKSCLFPKGMGIFTCRLNQMQEHLPYYFSERDDIFIKENAKKEGSKSPVLEDLINGKTQTLFYVPSSSELLELIRVNAQEGPQNALSPLSQHVSIDEIDVMDVDNILMKLTEMPKMIPYADQGETKTERKKTFEQAYSYKGLSLDLLQFFNSMLQIVTLEYLMGRNDSPGSQIMELENKVLCGVEFWKSDQYQSFEQDDDEIERLKTASEKVVARIMNAKKAQVDLSEDLNSIGCRFEQMNRDFIKKATGSDQLKLPFLKNLVKLQHQSSYCQFLSSLEQCLDIYLDHNSYKNFQKLSAEIFQLSRRDYGFNLLGNGVYINSSTRRSQDINPSSQMLRDQDQFEKSYQPMIDDRAMIPHQLQLVHKLYGQKSIFQVRATPHTTFQRVPDYKYMQSSFFNLDDEQRSFISSNYQQLDDTLTNYLVFQGHIQDPNKKNQSKSDEKTKILIHRPLEIMQAKCDYLGQRVESKHLQRVMMTWFTGRQVPFTIKDYLVSQKTFRDNTMLKILLERDHLIESYYQQKEANKANQDGGIVKQNNTAKQRERASILESVNVFSREHGIVSQLYQTKADLTICKQVLDVEMIKISIDIISSEQNSFYQVFDQNAANNDVHVHVHPTQQYASTLYQSVDKESHLNVVNKVEFVQSFLTKLRNRCTEVETLASGPGIVFSIKDFNECLQSFCQGLLKFCELELRSRVETSRIRENQYQHLLYMKEKQSLYYRRKCDQFLEDIDKLVNSKITQKGGQLLYELDVSQRELRVLRDNYRLMEKMMTVELRHEYIKEIEERDNVITRLRDAYKEEKSRVSKTAVVEIESDFKILLEHIEKKGQQAITQDLNVKRGPSHTSIPKNLANTGSVKSSGSLMQNQVQPRSTFETETLRECLGLQNYIRKYKMFNMMKNVISVVRHEKEMANQRAQLTSNAALWDQLAEAEKREQITKQELNLTKLSLASYEKLIEKLQGQLENLNNQKARLQQYKNTNSKRIDELQNKMKDLEILENIDLNKILTELKNRDKKIAYLNLETDAQKKEIDYIQHEFNNKEILRLQKELAQERELKNQAYERLEGMRVEMRALEAQDNKSDLWKDKCKELFDICKELEQENEMLKLRLDDAQTQLSSGGEFQFVQGGQVVRGNLSKSMGQVQTINKGLQNRGERFMSNRTVGQNANTYLKSNADFAGQEFRPSVGNQKDLGLPSVFGSTNHDGKMKNIGHDLDAVQSSQNQTTINTQNLYSRGTSGHPQALQNLQDQPDIVSVGSRPLNTQVTLNANGNFAGSTITGGVLGAPLQQFNQQRNISTAGGYGRQRPQRQIIKNVDELTSLHKNLTNQMNQKRVMTSNGPRGINVTQNLSKKTSHSIGAKGKRVQNPNLLQQHVHHTASLNMMGKKIGIEVSKQSSKIDHNKPPLNLEPQVLVNQNPLNNLNFDAASLNILNQ